MQFVVCCYLSSIATVDALVQFPDCSDASDEVKKIKIGICAMDRKVSALHPIHVEWSENRTEHLICWCGPPGTFEPNERDSETLGATR